MAVTTVVPGVTQLALGAVNAFLIESPDGLTLIDAGYPGSEAAILQAVAALGRPPGDLKRIVLTHAHLDHVGSAAALKRATGAKVFMHPVDAALLRRGESLRPVRPSPGFANAIIGRLILWAAKNEAPACDVDVELEDGRELPEVGGLRAIHAPGHCAGQIALLWPERGGVLFAADACANAFGLALSPVHEDLATMRASLTKLSSFDFEHATFGHGRPIVGGAAARFRAKWG